jgi:DNA-binding transcriptional regulator YhcF (GntR family)
VIYTLGPRARRVYTILRDGLLSGEFAPGTQLPSHTQLAVRFGVATLTVRHVLAHLEEEGLVSREHGRGTFARARPAPAVLIVEDDALTRTLLQTYVTKAGYRPIEASCSREGLAVLEQDRTIALVLSDIHLPVKQEGIGFIRAVARRWPEIPLAAVTGYPDDLAELHGRPECPFLVLAKPVRAQQIETVLRLVLQPQPAYRTAEALPTAPALVRSC